MASWKPDLGYLVRYRSKAGAESKRKVGTYTEAKLIAKELQASGNFKEIWITEGELVPRIWRDLEPKKPRPQDNDRRHFLMEDPAEDEH